MPNYAYIGRDEEASKTKAAETNEQPDLDDESANAPTLTKRFLDMERAIRTKIHHSTWKVKFVEKDEDKLVDAVENTDQKETQKQLEHKRRRSQLSVQ